MWQGLGDIINEFREDTLNLPPLTVLTGPLATHRMRVPFIYGYSTWLLPKPDDWRDSIGK